MPTRAELVTPDRTLFEGDAEFVVLRTDGGEIMFLPEHAPFIGAVDISLVRIAPPGAEEGGQGSAAPSPDEFRAAVHGGFVYVVDNTVRILASVAEPSDEIDAGRARRALEEARSAIAAGESERSSEAGEGEEQGQSQAMFAMLNPDDPEVRLRRAEVRLEAVGELEPGGSAAAASH